MCEPFVKHPLEYVNCIFIVVRLLVTVALLHAAISSVILTHTSVQSERNEKSGACQ